MAETPRNGVPQAERTTDPRSAADRPVDVSLPRRPPLDSEADRRPRRGRVGDHLVVAVGNGTLEARLIFNGPGFTYQGVDRPWPPAPAEPASPRRGRSVVERDGATAMIS